VTIAWASGIGILCSIGGVWLFETLGPGGPGSLPAAANAPTWGAIVGVVTWVFTLVATVALARSLPRRRLLFVVLSAVGPLIGWPVLGFVVNGLAVTWILPLYAVIGGIWGLVAAIISAIVVRTVVPSARDTRPSDAGPPV